ncbi:MAG TPA: DUF2252 family protein [Mycobacterium sp.]|nr:DUF2252 family protein [Mycobacterium sp.]
MDPHAVVTPAPVRPVHPGTGRPRSRWGRQIGTPCLIALIDAGDGIEPLFLQAKEVQPSVLAHYCGRSQYRNQAERAVAGQHLMQAESDMFLGWTHVRGPDVVDRDYYVCQLRDWKFSVPIEQMRSAGMSV